MVQARQIVGIFRDRGQARLAVAEALRWGLDVHIPDALAEGAHGVHVVLHIIGEPEAARRLLLEHGAYSAAVFVPGPD